MTEYNKETVWITIPDEATSASKAPLNMIKKDSYDRVKNRAFWGAGFVALMAFFALLLAPQEIAGLMQAQLFDGTFQVVPDYEAQQSGTLFGEGTGETAPTEATQDSGNQNVVSAESEAVTIQVEPVAEVSGDVTSADTGANTGTATATEGLSDTAVVTDGEVPAETVQDGTDLDANAKLLQSLSKQLDDFKEKQKQSDQQIQDLMLLLEDQASGVHGAASAASDATFLPGDQTGQVGTQGNVQIGSGMGAGDYRYNTHTVSVNPFEILAQNKTATQGAYQANVTYGGVQAYSNQAYNPVLAGVQGQPDTGPTEAMLFAFALASLGALVWGSIRAIKV